MRLIDADALKKTLEPYRFAICGFEGVLALIDSAQELGYEDGMLLVDIKDQIAGAYNEGYVCGNKEAEKARPQGEWKETGYETGALGITYRQTQCSNCGWGHALPMWLNFCPNCGAKMKGGAE